jgi:hypothetical protein
VTLAAIFAVNVDREGGRGAPSDGDGTPLPLPSRR